MPKLTTKQQRILNFIETYIESNGQSPSLFEIKQFLGVKALSTVHQHIRALEQKGYLQKDTGAARGINYVMNAGRFIGEFIRVPMVGTITAGSPIEAVEEVEEYIPVYGLLDTHNPYALRVRGDSMIDAHVLDGDIIVVEKISVANNGDMVVALNENNEATLKKFYDEGERIRLQPANQKYEPIYYPKGQVQIQGRVLTTIRQHLL
ncbi:MAG: transcriptional repressor LexA [Candidatus Dojkabacteria bacterium]